MSATQRSLLGRLSLLAGVNARVVSGLSVKVSAGVSGALESMDGTLTNPDGAIVPLGGTVLGIGTRFNVALGWAF